MAKAFLAREIYWGIRLTARWAWRWSTWMGIGWLDVIESSDYDPIADAVPPMRVRLGVGAGAFGGAQVQPGSPVFGYDLTVADLNGDGTMDVLSAGGNDLSLGNGDGTLSEGASFAPGVDYVSALAVGDLDGDGAVDVVLSRYNQPNQIHLNSEFGLVAFHAVDGTVLAPQDEEVPVLSFEVAV